MKNFCKIPKNGLKYPFFGLFYIPDTKTNAGNGRKEKEKMRRNYYYTFDEANGEANMRNHKNGKFVGGWYVKRHYRISGGERVGYWYSIHQRRAAK